MKPIRGNLSTQTLCFIGLFGALSTVLMLFKVPVFFAPGFMKLDLAELPAIIGSFMFGPVAGICIVCVKLLLNLIINGSDSMYVGELSNLLLSATYVLCASVPYSRKKTKACAAKSLVLSVVVTGVVALLSNAFFIFPAYAFVYGMEMESIVAMAGAVNPLVKDSLTLMLFSVFPFNILKFGAVSIITFFVYKRLHKFILQILK